MRTLLGLVILLAMTVPACSKKDGIIGIGTSVKAGTGTTAVLPFKAQFFPPLPIREYTVTIERVDISETGEDWKTIFTESKTVTVQGAQVVLAASGATAPAKEYQGVRVWFGSTFKARAIVFPGDTMGNDTVTNFDQGNPHVYSTRNGALAFPFTLEKETESDVIFDFDFRNSFTFESGSNIIFLDPNPKAHPTVSVRVTKFQG